MDLAPAHVFAVTPDITIIVHMCKADPSNTVDIPIYYAVSVEAKGVKPTFNVADPIPLADTHMEKMAEAFPYGANPLVDKAPCIPFLKA